MLPLELLKVIFGALARDDLDALMLTNVLFHDVVLRDFATEPLRYVASLNIFAHQSYEFVLTTGNRYLCEDNVDFGRRIQHGRVGNLLLLPTLHFDEALFQVLLPLKDAWQRGSVDAPCYFASTSLCERAFSELLFSESLSAFADSDSVGGQLGQSFMSLRAVRECTSLCIGRPPSPLSAAEIIGWLKADARSQEPKRLDISHVTVRGSVDNLVEKLKTDFVESTRARGYVVNIFADVFCGQTGRFVNKDTAEVLTVCFRNYVAVEVERKPIDKQ